MIKKTVFFIISFPIHGENILKFSIFIPGGENIKNFNNFFDFLFAFDVVSVIL